MPPAADISDFKSTIENKLSAVQLVNERDYSIPDAARSLGIHPANVRGWVGKFSNEKGVVPSGDGAIQVELLRLCK